MEKDITIQEARLKLAQEEAEIAAKGGVLLHAAMSPLEFMEASLKLEEQQCVITFAALGYRLH
jgi:hypothetical protein